LLGYVGSVGTFYLFDQVLKSFKTLRKYKKNARLIILNKGQHEYINSMLISSNINPRDVEIKEADYNEVAKEINKMDAGIFYIKPSFSKRSSSPTKLAEFLGCGKPCLTNFGVGDTESVIYDENVGIVLQDFSENEHIRGIIGLLELLSEAGLKERCVSAAHKHYSLEDGVASYDSMYSMLKGSLD
jgi:glycosyltransferase involved in cell wall biosynthesis